MDDMMDVREAANYLKINEQTLRRMARDGVLPAFKVGRIWRFKKSTLDIWAEEQQTARPVKANKTVLVIDDHPDVYFLIRDILKTNGISVISADNGATALDVIKENKPDFIFLDLKMPRMNGPQTLKAIREEFGNIPVAILTAFPDSDLMAEVLPHGPITLIRKPCMPQQIRDCVNNALNLN